MKMIMKTFHLCDIHFSKSHDTPDRYLSLMLLTGGLSISPMYTYDMQ